MSDVDVVYRYLLEQIRDAGGLPVRLDSRRKLAVRFGVSERVARNALSRLVREHLAVSKKGRGYFAWSLGGHGRSRVGSVGIVYQPGGADGVIDHRGQERNLCELTTEIKNVGMHVTLLPIWTGQSRVEIGETISRTTVDAYVLCSLSPEIQSLFAACGKSTVISGGTYQDLGFPNVGLNWLEISRKLTEQLFASGHKCVCLFQEYHPHVDCKRIMAGFEYAHHLWQIRFKRNRIISTHRPKEGLKPAIQRLRALSPTGMLVTSTSLLERLYIRADESLQKRLAEMEIIVCGGDPGGVLRHRARIVDVDTRYQARLTAKLLIDVLDGCSFCKWYDKIPWKLVNKA